MPQLLLPLFKIKKVSEIALEDIGSLCECITDYILEGEYQEVQMHQVLAEIHEHMDKQGGVWFLYKGKEVMGFLAGSVITSRYGEVECLVDYIFVNKEARLKGYAKKLAHIGIAWVKQQNVKKIIFATRRNAKAMCRFLPGKWAIEATVVSLCL